MSRLDPRRTDNQDMCDPITVTYIMTSDSVQGDQTAARDFGSVTDSEAAADAGPGRVRNSGPMIWAGLFLLLLWTRVEAPWALGMAAIFVFWAAVGGQWRLEAGSLHRAGCRRGDHRIPCRIAGPGPGPRLARILGAPP